jgi:hypothetical protein
LSGTTETSSNIFNPRCDATASGSEEAKKHVTLKSGGELFLCNAHYRRHELALIQHEAIVADILPMPQPNEPKSIGTGDTPTAIPND